MENRSPEKPRDTRLDRAVERVKALRKRGKGHAQAVSAVASEFGLKFDVIQRELSRRGASHRAAMARRMFAPPSLLAGEHRRSPATSPSVPVGDR